MRAAFLLGETTIDRSHAAKALVALAMAVLGGCSSAATTGAGGSGATGGPSVGTGASAGGAGASSGTSSSVSSGSGPVTPPADLIAPERITRWDPGVGSDAQLHLPLGADGLPTRTTICASLDPGADIQAAIDTCPEGQVVALHAGTFTIAKTLTLTKGVVLRGAGSSGAPSGTTIVKTGGESVIAIGTARDSICYGGTGTPLTVDAAKESKTITIGASASDFSPGDLALVDLVDDAQIDEGDCPYFKRVDHRSVSQRVEIASVDAAAGTVTLDAPLHWDFKAGDPYRAEITRVTEPVVRFAGVESLRLKGGSNPGYNGQMAGGIDMSNAAHAWVKDVQTDETIGGMHVSMTGTYRSVVRDSYLHHSADYGFGHDCYGVVLRCGAAENLIENNVVRYMNKPILFNVSGGGNVVGYNYADNSWASPAEWQEVNVDCHCSFPHMELMEGNWAPHMGASTTHGNAGYLTYYRNYASSKFASPVVAGADVTQTGNVTALEFDGGDVGMNVLGNVLGEDGVSQVLDATDSGPRSIFEIGANGAGVSDVAMTSLFRHGNFDYVGHAVSWDAKTTSHTLPPSFYLSSAPAWWPASTPWPWVGPDATPMVGVLPAKARADAMP